MTLNTRKDEDILNDLHSAEGRLDSSEIIDLKTKLETNKMKKEIQKTTTEDELDEVKKSFMEEVQKNLFAETETADKKNERQERFKDFLEFRKIQELFDNGMNINQIAKLCNTDDILSAISELKTSVQTFLTWKHTRMYTLRKIIECGKSMQVFAPCCQ